MKFKNYLESIVGVGIYPVITLIIFFTFFSILTIWVFRSQKNKYDEISNLPLDGADSINEQLYSNS